MHFTVANPHLGLPRPSKFCPYIQICSYKHGPYMRAPVYHDVCLLALTRETETVLKSIGLQLPGALRVGSLIKTSEPAESEENASEHAMRRL